MRFQSGVPESGAAPTLDELIERARTEASGPLHLQSWDLQGQTLVGSELRGADLRGANLHGARLERLQLGNANLAGADLSAARLILCGLEGADLTGANLRGAHLASCDLTLACLDGSNLRGARLNQVTLVESSCRCASFHSAELWGCNFQGADLSEASFARAKPDGSRFEKTKLEGVRRVIYSRELVAEIFARHAGDDILRLSVAGTVRMAWGYCWDALKIHLQQDFPELYRWCLEVAELYPASGMDRALAQEIDDRQLLHEVLAEDAEQEQQS